MQDWYMTNSDSLDALSFDAFATMLKKRWLKSGWENDVVTSIIRSRQKDADSFE